MNTTLFVLYLLSGQNSPHVVAAQTYQVGVSKVDVTPDYPVRLHGFGFRKTESEGVKQRIWVKGLAIGDQNPVILLVADNLGVPRAITDAVAGKLSKYGVRRDRLCICATHTHTAPMLVGVAPTIFGADLPEDHRRHVERYTQEFVAALVRAAELALADRKPSTLSWGTGSLRLAVNRRPQGGPVDHDLPAMFVKDAQGKVRATLASYACHCVTLSFNLISGDWAGCAAESIENQFPGSVALIAIGCGADSNPSSGVTKADWAVAERQGREFAAEVRRLAKGFLAPLSGAITSRCKAPTLPLADLPTNEEWSRKAAQKNAVGHHARVQQRRIAQGKALRSGVDYEVCVWSWGDHLAMAFLPGEVVAEYSLRLKKELDARRLWVNAYANDAPCYIPSERVLKEGGYEGEFAMVYYDLPTKFKPGIESTIVNAVKACAGTSFAAPLDAGKVQTPPRSPQQSQASIRVGDDLAVDLVAAEPLVFDPCAIAFGPDGRLWVAEINDYPSGHRPQEPGGRIRYLEDRNGDGNFDSSTTFLSGIPYPTGVTVWRNGVLICAAPDILYAEDADGDGRADVVRKVFTGFATHNFHARVNSLEYGLDGWVYGSCGLLGGDIRNERGEVVRLGRRDFRCKPDQGLIEPAAGSTQQGRVRTDWDDWFGCDNTLLGGHYPLPADVLGRNPHAASPRNQVRIPDGSAARIFPAADLQMFALSGPAGQATAACGIGIYRDHVLGSGYAGDFFTCEPVHLAVHRMKLERNGSSFNGRRPPEEGQREFLASNDQWFRPVQVRTGTDGALWVVDMYRHVIEHPMWIPPEERPKHDMRAGSTMGRIYRVRPKSAPPGRLPSLQGGGPLQIAASMDSPNGTVRDLVMQRILWGNERQCAPELRRIAAQSAFPAARVQAMCTLDGLGASEALRDALAREDPFPGVRRHQVRLLAERLPEDPETVERLRTASTDSAPEVRLQAAISIGRLKGGALADVLARLASRADADEFLRAAVLSSVNHENVAAVVEKAIEYQASPQAVKPLVASAVGFGQQARVAAAARIGGRPTPSAFAALEGLLQGLRRNKAAAGAETALAASIRNSLIGAARQAQDGSATDDRRVSCLRLFGYFAPTAEAETKALASLLGSGRAALQSAAVEAAARLANRTGFQAMMDHWDRLLPTQRREAMTVLVQHPAGARVVVEAIDAKKLSAAEVDPARRDALLKHPDEAVRSRARALFEPALKDREAVIAAYHSVRSHVGDASRGKSVFTKHCAPCHRLDDVGSAVGPDLAIVSLKPAEYLLMEILDPNRNLDARYMSYTALTSDGRTVTGLLAGESESSVSLVGQDGKRIDLLRSEVDRIAALGKSLMPEGLEQQIPPAQMADLLAYLRRRLPPPKSFHGNTPALIGLKDGRYSLLARFAELRGPTIRFEVPQFAVGYWQSAEDFAAWEVDVGKAGRYSVELEYGCDDLSAGNTASLDVGGQPLAHQVAGTGGWERYQKVRIGEVQLEAGRRRVTMRPGSGPLKGALLDLRAIHLIPKS